MAEFLTKNELLRFGTITHLLNIFDSLNNGVYGKVEDLHPEIIGRPNDAYLFNKLIYLTKLLVRGPEILAIVPSGPGNSSSQPKFLTIAANPRPDDWKSLPPTPTADDSAKISVKLAPRRNHVFTAKNCTDAVTEMMGKEVPYHEHVEMTIALLKAHHSATEEQDRSILFGCLSIYIFASSINKIKSNIERGMDGKKSRVNSNLWEILTYDWTSLGEKFNEKADNLLLTDLDDTKLLESKRHKRLLVHYSVNDGEGVKKIFDKLGRRRLLKLLRAAVLEIGRVVYGITSAKEKTPETSPTAKSIFNAAHCAVMPFRMFSLLLESFANVMPKLLRWIQTVFDITSTTAVGGNVWHHTNQVRTVAEVAQMNLDMEIREKRRSECTEDESGGDDQAELETARHWSNAAWKYLQLCCSHQTSLSELQKSSTNPPGFSNFCTNVQVSVVLMEPKYSGDKFNQMASIKSLLQTMIPNEKIRKDVHKILQGAKDAGYEMKSLDETHTTGTWHAETILLSLYALILDNNGSTNVQNFEDIIAKVSGVIDLSPDVLSNLQDMRHLIAISKRCCPACKLLVENMNLTLGFTSKKEVLHTGVHSKWSCVTLTPFLPRKYALKLYEDAELALRKQMMVAVNKLAAQEEFERMRKVI